eukprot:SAG31_NODE_2434_length_5705_cov_6.754014_2_plen_118_part_00
MLAQKSALDSDRQSKQLALNERLAQKRKALAEKQKQSVLGGDAVVAAVVDEQVSRTNAAVVLESTPAESEIAAAVAVAAAETAPQMINSGGGASSGAQHLRRLVAHTPCFPGLRSVA